MKSKFYNKEDFRIEYEPKDTKQPYRVVNKERTKTEIVYFCETREEALNVIENINEYLNKEK